MKTASRAQAPSPPLVPIRRYPPGGYPFLLPSIIGSLLPQQRLQLQQPCSSPSPAGESRQTDRQACQQTDRPGERETDRETDRPLKPTLAPPSFGQSCLTWFQSNLTGFHRLGFWKLLTGLTVVGQTFAGVALVLTGNLGGFLPRPRSWLRWLNAAPPRRMKARLGCGTRRRRWFLHWKPQLSRCASAAELGVKTKGTRSAPAAPEDAFKHWVSGPGRPALLPQGTGQNRAARWRLLGGLGGLGAERRRADKGDPVAD